MCLEKLMEGLFWFSVRDREEVRRKLLSLVLLNFQLLAKLLNFIFIEVTWKLSYLKWLNFVQENWLRGHTSCLHWKWLICFRIWCQTFPPKMWVLRFQDLQFLWLIGHSWSPKIKYCMSGKHSVNLSISAGGLNLLPNLKTKKKQKKWGKGGLTWTQFLDGGCWEDRGEIFQDGGGACSFYIKIN